MVRFLRAQVAVASVALIAAAGCAASASHQNPSVSRASTPISRAAAAYMTIAVPANHRLDHGFDRLSGQDKANLARSRADLLGIAATEQQFDSQLQALRLPAAAGYFAQLMVTVNQRRERLTLTAAGSATLAQLRTYEKQLTAANVPVEQAAALIRIQLGLPPPSTS